MSFVKIPIQGVDSLNLLFYRAYIALELPCIVEDIHIHFSESLVDFLEPLVIYYQRKISQFLASVCLGMETVYLPAFAPK